ncbi:hypothetical protein FIU88_02490 [Halomonas sp. THAF12]|uniref:hypothetical protein n=1 Tax=Halomonas sp. THAF12 TaxID=2587849 RepID=UPI001267F855|nr:hypothetical protein [Halomonas sp. THAF12]QFT83833.1 hypothetical protein FIU88_02490 [Halomonas sp. THAF12]
MLSSTHRKAALVALPLLCLSAGAQALDWQATPTYGTVNLNSGFQPDPHVTSLTAGGSRSASEAGPNCSGYVSGDPDLDLNYQAGQYTLSIYAEAQQDITLVVYDAAGNWHCNDDYSTAAGTNPGIKWNDPPSGNYNIWVGTYASGDLPQANLYVSEASPSWSGAGASSGSSRSSNGIEWGDNTSRWANDGECDDPRFAGPGVHSLNIDEDRYHDANDCRSLYEQGQVYLK